MPFKYMKNSDSILSKFKYVWANNILPPVKNCCRITLWNWNFGSEYREQDPLALFVFQKLLDALLKIRRDFLLLSPKDKWSVTKMFYTLQSTDQ